MMSALKTLANPDTRKSWTISVEITSLPYVMLRYIPDRLIFDHGSVKSYLLSQSKKQWDTPEAMLLGIIEDVNNELVPKWLEVTYELEDVTIIVEDQRPDATGIK